MMRTRNLWGAGGSRLSWLLILSVFLSTTAWGQTRPTNTPRPTRTPRRSPTPNANAPTATPAATVTLTRAAGPIDTPTVAAAHTPTRVATDTPPSESTATPVVIVTEAPVSTATAGRDPTSTRTLRLRTRTITVPPTATSGLATATIGPSTPPTTLVPTSTLGPGEIPTSSPTPTATLAGAVGAAISFRVGGRFQVAEPPAAAAVPVALAVGNFNATVDENADVIVADAATNTIRWGEGNGRGTVHFRPGIPVGLEPSALAVADFNADGEPDVAVGNAGDGSISIVLARGQGRFDAEINTSIGGEPRALAAIGNRLLIADASRGTVIVANVDANGSVSTIGSLTVGARPVAVVTGDVNRDGRVDAVVANRGSNSVTLLLGTDDGGFRRGNTLSTGAGPSALALGDLDRDGDLDLAIAQSDDNDVSVWRGDGRGAFVLAVTLAAGVAPSAVAIIDDVTLRGVGEQNPDLFVANAGSNDVILFGGRGNLSFQLSNRLVAGRLPVAMVVAQLDNNTDTIGNADVVVAGSGDGYIGVLRGQGDGSFVAAAQYKADAIPKGLTVGDFDGDADPDVVAANQLSGNVSFLKGNGRAGLNPRGAPTNTAAGTAPQKVASGDFNADGRRDLALVLASGELRLLLGQGDGTFTAPTFLDRGIREVEAHDFNLDGNGDIVALRADGNAASVWLGGSGGLTRVQDIPLAGSPRAMALADGNRDNVLDLYVAAVGSNTVEIFHGTSPFQAAGRIDLGETPTSVAAVDFDQDGIIDVAVLFAGSNRVRIFNGLPGGLFSARAEVAVDEGAIKILGADINGDPFPDLIVVSQSTDRVSIFPSDGRARFSAPTQILVGRGPADIVAVDLNDNRFADLVVSSAAGQTITVLRNVTAGTAPVPTPTLTPGRGTPTVPQPLTPLPTVPGANGGGGSNSGDGGGGGLGCTMQEGAPASPGWAMMILAAAASALRRRRR